MPRPTLSPNRKTRKNQVRRTVASLVAAALIAQFLAGAWSSAIIAPEPGGTNSCDVTAWQTTLNAALQCLPLLAQKPTPRAVQYARCAVALISLFSERCEERS
jgi:hypothetical protein